MNATQLLKGEKALITKIEINTLRCKLLEMGCYPGNTIQMKQKAPLGDPIAFDIGGYTLALRKDEAKLIEVEKI